MSEETKKCSYCKAVKPLSEFAYKNVKGIQKISCRCKRCIKRLEEKEIQQYANALIKMERADNKALSDIQRKASEMGMSYGQYVARYETCERLKKIEKRNRDDSRVRDKTKRGNL